MHHTMRWKLTLLVGLVATSLPPGAKADFDSHSISIPAGTTTDFHLALTLPTFDSTLGKLDNVYISYNDDVNVNGTVTNTSVSAQSFKVSEVVNFNLSYGGSLILNNGLAADQSFSSLGVGETAVFGPKTASDVAGPLLFSDGALFDAFLNSPTGVTFDLSTLTKTIVSGGGGNITTGVFTQADATLSVLFDYETNPNVTPTTPEPASALMLGLGGLAVASAGFVRRKMRARAVHRA